MKEDLVSVVIVCRDRGRVIEDAMDSVYAQTHSACEILVIDDGSTEPFTRRVLAGFDWPNTTVLRQPMHHEAAARNLGLKHARGRYLCCLDAGDRLAPSYLEKAVAALERTPAAAFGTAQWTASGAVETEVRLEECGLTSLLAGLPHPGGVVRLDAAREAGGFDEDLGDGGADHDLWLRLVQGGRPGLLLEEPLLFWRCETLPSGHAPSGPFLTPSFLRKHAELYGRHAVAVLERREWLVARLLTSERAAGSGPMPEHVKALERAQRRIEELEAALEDARGQVAHLRASLTWRLTEPVRALLRRLARLRPSGPASMPPSRPAP